MLDLESGSGSFLGCHLHPNFDKFRRQTNWGTLFGNPVRRGWKKTTETSTIESLPALHKCSINSSGRVACTSQIFVNGECLPMGIFSNPWFQNGSIWRCNEFQFCFTHKRRQISRDNFPWQWIRTRFQCEHGTSDINWWTKWRARPRWSHLYYRLLWRKEVGWGHVTWIHCGTECTNSFRLLSKVLFLLKTNRIFLASSFLQY